MSYRDKDKEGGSCFSMSATVEEAVTTPVKTLEENMTLVNNAGVLSSPNVSHPFSSLRARVKRRTRILRNFQLAYSSNENASDLTNA